MRDIVERLREQADQPPALDDGQLMMEAADELRRLRNEVADLRSYAKACREWMENSPIRSVKG